MKKSRVPPLGVKPRWLIEEERIADLKAAVLRFLEANRPIPQMITDEYNELTEKLEED